jgi:hypothetical protein
MGQGPLVCAVLPASRQPPESSAEAPQASRVTFGFWMIKGVPMVMADAGGLRAVGGQACPSRWVSAVRVEVFSGPGSPLPIHRVVKRHIRLSLCR